MSQVCGMVFGGCFSSCQSEWLLHAAAIGKVIDMANRNTSPGLVHINLKSLMIGNGLVDPQIQAAYYPEAACNNTCEHHETLVLWCMQ